MARDNVPVVVCRKRGLTLESGNAGQGGKNQSCQLRPPHDAFDILFVFRTVRAMRRRHAYPVRTHRSPSLMPARYTQTPFLRSHHQPLAPADVSERRCLAPAFRLRKRLGASPARCW